MAQPSLLAKRGRGGDGGGESNSNSSSTTIPRGRDVYHSHHTKIRLRTCMAILTLMIAACLFGIEFIVYHKIDDGDGGEGLLRTGSTSAAASFDPPRKLHDEKLYHLHPPVSSSVPTIPVGDIAHPHRHRHDKVWSRRDSIKTATPRNGFVLRGALRTETLHEVDHLLEDRSNTNKTAWKTTKKRKHLWESAGDLWSDTGEHGDHLPMIPPGLDMHEYTKARTTKASFEARPRSLVLDNNLQISTAPQSISSKTRRRVSVEQRHHRPYTNNHVLPFERPYLKECEPVVQTTVHPTCNSLHEYSLQSTTISLLSTKGSWRSAWKVLESNRQKYNHSGMIVSTSNETKTSTSTTSTEPAAVVLKLLHLNRHFDAESYQAHATDVVVMDRLTASPYVVNAYGFCGQSVVTEYAPAPGRDHIKSYEVRNRARLKLARDLARGLADIQALEPLPWQKTDELLRETMSIRGNNVTDLQQQNSSNITREQHQWQKEQQQLHESQLAYELQRRPPVFAHNDINIANTVLVAGRVKWNDFNIGAFLRKPKAGRACPTTIFAISNTNDTFSTQAASTTLATDLCPGPVKYRSDLWRSPEEIRNTSYVHLHMSDIYGFANILYQTMTRHQPWTHKEPSTLTIANVADRKTQGLVPTVPDQYRNATQKDLQALYVATRASYHPDPGQRPSALRLAMALSSLYDRLQYKTGRVSRAVILDFFFPNRR